MTKENVIVTIYCLIDPFTLKVRYIGRTRCPLKDRLHYHVGKAKSMSKKGGKLCHAHNWINKCRINGRKPIIRKLCVVKGWSESHIVEKALIHKYKERLTNSDDRGEGGFNRTISQDQKQNISNTLKKKYATGEVKSKSKKRVYVYNYHGDYLRSYSSRAECAKALSIDKSNIFKVLNGSYNQINGYQFSDIKVDFMKNLNLESSNICTEILLQDTDNNTTVKFKSIAECNKALELTKYSINLYRLPYELKRKYGDKYKVLNDNVNTDVTVLNKVYIKNIKTSEILQFASYKELGKFIGLSRSKSFKSYIDNKLKKEGMYLIHQI